ncbi:hypothetical protein [Streptomyces sp. NPDC085932]|uniref:hypothetical protein n=1 Tax=Streptomyces sp. NPDC085932 TaxID=3365741 RepID=UPI0037D04D14
MGLLVEARGVSALGADGLLFTCVSGTVHTGQLAVISGRPGLARTALLLALCGRFVLTGGSLHTDRDYRLHGPRALRQRIAVARAKPSIMLDGALRIGEAVTERRVMCGRRRGFEQACWHAWARMGLEKPPVRALVSDLDPVERVLFAVALAQAQGTDGIAVDDIDDSLGAEDRAFVRQALSSIVEEGTAVLATCADDDWAEVRIPLEAPHDPGDDHPGGSPASPQPAGDGDAARPAPAGDAIEPAHDAAPAAAAQPSAAAAPQPPVGAAQPSQPPVGEETRPRPAPAGEHGPVQRPTLDAPGERAPRPGRFRRRGPSPADGDSA